MSPREQDALRLWATDLMVLELGAWHGLGTVNLARTALHVVSVDHHQGDADTGPTATLGAYMANLEENDVRRKVTTVVGRFSLALPLLRLRQFGLVVVDGAHDRASVAHDVAWARRMVDSRGTIAVHDWDRPDVMGAAMKHLGAPGHIVETLAFYEYGR